MFNPPAKHLMLNALDESAAGGITHVGIHTATDPGTGTNANAGEATGGAPAYARQAVTWGAASGEQKANSGALTFEAPAADYGFFTFWNASTGNTNNYLGYAPFDGTLRGFGEVDAGGVTANEIDSEAHGLINTDRVMVFNTLGETLPTGLTEGVIYFVVGSAADTFQVSLTSGGAAVDITDEGELFYQKLIIQQFATQGQITVAISALVLDQTVI